jgi:HEAT repeat protein
MPTAKRNFVPNAGDMLVESDLNRRNSLAFAIQQKRWQDRAKAFYAAGGGLDFGKSATKPSHLVRGQLIALLDLEQRETEKSSDEEFDFYLGSLLSAVGNVGDPRSIPILLEPRVLNSGGRATRTLAGFGDAALPAIRSALRASSTDKRTRLSLAMTLEEMLSSNRVAGRPRSEVEETVAQLTNDTDRFVRLVAARSMIHVEPGLAMTALNQLLARETVREDAASAAVMSEATRALSFLR